MSVGLTCILWSEPSGWHFTVFGAIGYGEKQQWGHTESV